MVKKEAPNWTREDADTAMLALMNLADTIQDHESYQDVYDEAASESRGKTERFRTLERKAAKVGQCLKDIKVVATDLRFRIRARRNGP